MNPGAPRRGLLPLADLDAGSRERWLTRSYAERRPHVFPDYLVILITNRCPLRCRGCATHDWARTNKDRELSAARWREVVEQARELGADKLMLSGGEPLLRAEDCADVLGHARSLGMRTALMTSGRGLRPDLLGDLYRDGLNELSTSLDGPTAAVHDAWRGTPGSFDEVAGALGAARALRGSPRPPRGDRWDGEWSTHVMTVIAGHDPGWLVGTYHRARALGADLVSFQCLSPDERFPSLKVRDADLPALSDQVDRLIGLLRSGAPISNSEGFLRQVVPYFAGRMEVPDDRCLAGYSRLILAPDGSVSSCRESLSRRARLIDGDGRASLRALWTSRELGRAREAMEGCENRCLLRCWVDG